METAFRTMNMKMSIRVLVAAMALASALPAAAQEVPALGRRVMEGVVVPEVNLISNAPVKLSDKEQHAVALAAKWMDNPDKPRWESDGSVRYLYGATLPTLVCAPMQICVIRLEPGETVNQIDAADKQRWKFKPTLVGSPQGEITEIVVKPTDSGLEQSIRIATDRRGYTIKLLSTPSTWIPMLAFDYPEDVDREWAAYAESRAKKAVATTLPTGQTFGELDFGFRMSGDKPAWLPLRVYTDGVKTYIQFPDTMQHGESPALVAMDGGQEQLVNYRAAGDRYVIDKVIERAALISGVGRDQRRVTISRTKSR